MTVAPYVVAIVVVCILLAIATGGVGYLIYRQRKKTRRPVDEEKAIAALPSMTISRAYPVIDESRSPIVPGAAAPGLSPPPKALTKDSKDTQHQLVGAYDVPGTLNPRAIGDRNTMLPHRRTDSESSTETLVRNRPSTTPHRVSTRVKGPRRQPGVGSPTSTVGGTVTRSNSGTSSHSDYSTDTRFDRSLHNYPLTPARSAVTPVTPSRSPRPPPRPRRTSSVGTYDSSSNAVPTSLPPPMTQLVTTPLPTTPRPGGRPVSKARSKRSSPTTPLPFSPTSMYSTTSAESIYPESACSSPASPASLFRAASDAPPVPAVPIVHLPDGDAPLRNDVVETSEWRKERDTFGGGSIAEVVSPAVSRVSHAGSHLSVASNTSRGTHIRRSSDNDPVPLSAVRAHHRGASLEDNYYSRGVETTVEREEASTLATPATPATARSGKFRISNDRVLTTVDEHQDEPEGASHPPSSFTPPRVVGPRGHTRTDSEWTTSSTGTPSLAHSDDHNDRYGSCVSIQSNLSSAETSHIHTPKSSMFEFDMNSPAKSALPTAPNAYLHPTARAVAPAYPDVIDLSRDTIYELDSDVAARALMTPSAHSHGYFPPDAQATKYTTKTPVTPGDASPNTPVSLAAYSEYDNSWGTNPDAERALMDHIRALQANPMPTLNMAALNSFASVASAVPSTPGGPDHNPPSPTQLLAHAASIRSLNSLKSLSRRSTLAPLNPTTTPTPPPHPRLYALQIDGASSEHLNTPNVQPPDWDVTMWTRANVDGTL